MEWSFCFSDVLDLTFGAFHEIDNVFAFAIGVLSNIKGFSCLIAFEIRRWLYLVAAQAVDSA